ncbi:clan AA aspartic protease [Campylobacter estrildidarum]|uniref:Clan AA aspartic protease n=1 Tax=Campylobacter estrildidarum TaxID=2510189 RepID=A0A4U7BJT7_9BACT|nr:clan AA aspartic protease [Campylobacter estrildidarum]TKX30455.1 clan AA aspartic protease [Campylobacter estrildidarum]
MLFLLKKILPRLFISVILGDKKSVLKTSVYRNQKLLSSSEKTFNKSEKALEHVKNISKKFLFFNTALFLDAKEQGLIPSTDEKDFERFDIGKMSLKSITLNNALVFAATEHVEYFNELFEDYNGLDFLYSPFALLYYKISKKNINDNKITLYAYYYNEILAIMICKNKTILYGDLIFFEQESENTEEFLNESSENIPNKELELDNFNENLEEPLNQENNLENSDDNSEFNLEDFNQFSSNMELCRYIISSIEKFYKDEKYSGTFIEHMYIYSEKELGISAIEFLEDETFLEITAKQVNTLELMIELMQKEIQ